MAWGQTFDSYHFSSASAARVLRPKYAQCSVIDRDPIFDPCPFSARHRNEQLVRDSKINGRYAPTSALSLGLAYVYTDAHVDNNGAIANDPKWSQVDAQAVYSFSKRTDVYLEGIYQRAIGQGVVAFINGSGGASSSGNQVVTMVGMRTRF
jgi:predicted porin